MTLPKYDGNVHPDEWLIDIRSCGGILSSAILSVDPFIKLPDGINDFDKLRNALKQDISFTVFKNTNRRKLQSLRYVPEREGGDNSKFVSTFRKLCYNAEINDKEEQKKYLCRSLPMKHFNYVLNEFHERMKNANSTEELIKEFESIVLEESNLIRHESVVALKHVATEKYLSSVELRYTTGSKSQLVFAGSLEPGLNSLWKIQFNEELATYADTSITLCHLRSNKVLGICHYYSCYGNYNSPVTGHKEVSCIDSTLAFGKMIWKFNHSKLENNKGYLKSNDIINLSIIDHDDQEGFLRSRDSQFTVENKTFQEVVLHSERLGGNDEWCIEVIHEANVL